MSVQVAILIGLAIYGCLMLAVSFYWMGKVKNASDYLLAGRGLPYWILTGTTVGTCIGTGVVIGATGLAYQHGWAGCAYAVGLGLGTVLVGLGFAVMRRHNFMTLSEEIACYYSGSRPVLEFANVSLFVSQLCWLTVQIMGGSAVLSVVTPLDPAVCTVLSGLITALISIPGGLKSVVYTDFLQATILLGGFGILGYTALHQSGGVDGLRAAVPPERFSFLGIDSYGGWKVFSLILTIVLSIIADPSRRLTMYSADTEKSARWSMITSGVIVIGFSVVVGIVGMYAYRLNPNLPRPDQTLPWLIMHVLPGWLASIVVVSVASAVFSSANGNAAAAGTFYVRHIFPLVMGRYPAQPLKVVRWTMCFVFLLSTVIALRTGSIVGFVVKFLPVTMSGLAVIVLLGRFWPRANWQGALAALITTPAVALILSYLPGFTGTLDNPIIPATVAGVLAQVITSLVTPAGTRSFSSVVDSMRIERDKLGE